MKRMASVCAALCCFGSGASAFALTLGVTSDPNVLTSAFLGSGSAITIISSSYSGAGTASATYSEGPLGISNGMLLTSGGATLAQPPSEPFKVSQENNQPGDPLCDALIPGFPSKDAVKLTIQFSLAPGFNGLSFQFIFGSDEFPEFAGGAFADVFGVYLDGTQVAFDSNGNPITINGPFFSGGSVVAGPATETEYDGSTSLLTTKAPAMPGMHTLEIVICDGGDQAVDSGAFVAGLSGCVGGCTGTGSCKDVDNDADGANSCVDCNDADPTVHPGPSEVCDGKDNDCDGAIDQGDPGSGLPCSSGLSGICDAGTTSCADGATVCTANTAPGSTPEICDNGIDEDCNGTADDDPSCGAGGGGGGGATGSGGGATGGGGGSSSSSGSGGDSSSSSGGNDDGFYATGNGLFCSMRSGKSEGSRSAWVLALAAGALAYRRRRSAS